jgi:LPS-assembly lipoprotein
MRRRRFLREALVPALREVLVPALRTAVLALPLATAAGCGFRLRGSQQLPFETLYLAVPENSALGAELARNIRVGTSTEIVTDRSKAQAVLELIGEQREREVLALDGQGRVREYQLRLTLLLRVTDGKGREFLRGTPLGVQRDIAFNEAQVLAREAEETMLYRDMQTDLVQQIVRRLAAIKVAG